MKDLPRVTFGMIVLNGEPFVRYNLRALYPFAHQIIVVEGASPGAKSIATPDGHSSDGTLETLQDFKANEDPQKKLTIVTAEDEGYPDGFWPGEKHEQSQAYAQRATGDYLWQVDVDEFYKPEDVKVIMEMLRDDPQITAASFKQIQFWGGFSYYVDSWYLQRGGEQFHRLFHWGPEYAYKTHRPPTVVTAGDVDTRSINWVDAYEMERQGIYLYHYSLVFPKQVIEKCEYYGNAAWARRDKARQWAQEAFLELRNPYRVHNVYEYPGWLERFSGDHPPQIEALRADLKAGRLNTALRPTDDIERLLRSLGYRLGRVGLKLLEPWDRHCGRPMCRWRHRLLQLFKDPTGSLVALRHKASQFLARWS